MVEGRGRQIPSQKKTFLYIRLLLRLNGFLKKYEISINGFVSSQVVPCVSEDIIKSFQLKNGQLDSRR